MSLRDELSADLGKAIALYGQTVTLLDPETDTWVSYACTRRAMPVGYEFQDGGEVHKVAESILVQRSLFDDDALPAVGDGIDGNVAQIKAVDPNGENLILMIGSFDEP